MFLNKTCQLFFYSLNILIGNTLKLYFVTNKIIKFYWFSPEILYNSVQFGHSVVSDSLRPHESQRARPPCLSPTPGVHSDSRPSSHWCHPAISSSVVPFCSCPPSLPVSESFPMSQLFVWGGQSTGASALASFLPKKSQGWSLQNELVGSPCSPRDSILYSCFTRLKKSRITCLIQYFFLFKCSENKVHNNFNELEICTK